MANFPFRGLLMTTILSASLSASGAEWPDKLTVEWIHSEDARLASEIPSFRFAGPRLMRYDVTRPVGERTIELLDPATGEVALRVDRAKALESLVALLPKAKETLDSDGEPKDWLGLPSEIGADGGRALYVHEGDVFVLDFASSAYRRLTTSETKEKSARVSPDGRSVAFVRENDLYVVDLESGAEKRLTRDGSETTLNGTLSWVYWEELFGRSDRGYSFSPDSKRIAYFQFDESPVDVMTYVDPRPDATKVVRQRYPKAGTTNPRVRAGIVDLEGAATTWIDLGAFPYEYLARIDWMPDSSGLVVQTLDRAQQNLDVFMADAANGDVRHLFRETDDGWVDVRDDLVFLDGGKRFLWVSSRKGHDHVFLYELTTGGVRLVRQVTSGDWSVFKGAKRADGVDVAIAAVDEAKQTVFFMSGMKSHLETHLHAVGLDGKGLRQLTRDDGVHATVWSADGRWLVDTHSSVTRPPGADLRSADGAVVKRLFEQPTRVADHFGFTQPELMTVKAPDGFELPALMQRPKSFDPEKRYPAIVNVYGGPAAPRVRNRWTGGLLDHLLNAEGYVVFTIDPRTSTAMGKPTTKLLLRDFYGEREAADIVAGVRWLKAQPWVDPERVGVTGWSGGGSTTLSVMTRSKEFRAGIAGAGVYDYRLYDTIYTERYMKHPEENPKGYEQTALASRAADLHGRLLLIHGSYDDNVHPQNTWRLVDELVKAGIVFDLAIYPMQKHGFTSEKAKLHLSKTRLDFWKRELGAGPE
jgi:dipeptidyl-peptidase 4